jgi:ABC-type branched-subunit amino acid transport system substrate-binding protein
VKPSIKVVASISILVAVLVACGSRVVPLSQGTGLQGTLVNPSVGPSTSVAPTVGSTFGPGAGPSIASSIPPGIVNAACHATKASDVGITATTIKLGLVAALTGPLPGQFDSAVEATDTFFRAVNDAGGICGRKVQLLIRDDNGNGQTDKEVATKLVVEDKIFAFVGSVSAPDDSGIAQVSKQYHVPDIGFPLSWARAENPYAYGAPGQLQRTTIGANANGSGYFNKLFGIKQVAVFWLKESEVSILEAYGFEAAMEYTSGAKLKICHEQPSGVLDSNYTNYVVAMKGDCDPANGPVAVYTTMENNSNIKLAKAMRDQGFKPAVFAPTFSSYLPSFITDAGGATEGAYLPMPQVPIERLTDTPQSQWTPGTYELKRYIDALNRYYPSHHPPGSFGAPGWAEAGLFGTAAAGCGDALTRACLFNKLNTMGPYSANGFVVPTVPSDHHIYTSDLIVQVRNGKFVEIQPNNRSGPPGAPDFWDRSVLIDWQKYMCAHQNDKNPDGTPLFPNMSTKKALLTEC